VGLARVRPNARISKGFIARREHGISRRPDQQPSRHP
jgi:hypothetical protein